MTKCMFQDCNCEATRTFPVLIGPTEEDFVLNLCDDHYKLMNDGEYYKKVSFEIKEV